MRVVLDTDRCTGHGRCYSLAPEVYDCDDDGHAVLRSPEVPAGMEPQARLGADNCPERALAIQE